MSDKGIEFKGINVIGKNTVTQTINNPAPGAEPGETKKDYISARVTASEKAALKRIKDETGYTISDIAGQAVRFYLNFYPDCTRMVEYKDLLIPLITKMR